MQSFNKPLRGAPGRFQENTVANAVLKEKFLEYIKTAKKIVILQNISISIREYSCVYFHFVENDYKSNRLEVIAEHVTGESLLDNFLSFVYDDDLKKIRQARALMENFRG